MAGETYTQRYAGGFKNRPDVSTPADAQFLNAVEAALLRLLGEDPAADELGIWTPGSGRFVYQKLKNAHVDAAAAIARSKLDFGAGLVNADIAAGAAIAKSKLAALGITNADIDAAAAIVASKLAPGANGQVMGTFGGAAAWRGGMQLIEEKAISGLPTTLTFSAIPGDFKHLYLVGTVLTNLGASANVWLRINGVAAAQYHAQIVTASGATVAGNAYSATTEHLVTGTHGSWSSSPIEITIPDYTRTGDHKQIFSRGMNVPTATSVVLYEGRGVMIGTAGAVSSLSLRLDAGAFSSGVLSLYGVS